MQQCAVAFERRELAPDRVAAEGRDESAASRRVVALVAASRSRAQLPLRIRECAAFCCRCYEEQRGARRENGETIRPPRHLGGVYIAPFLALGVTPLQQGLRTEGPGCSPRPAT